jgi:hypothetical protein
MPFQLSPTNCKECGNSLRSTYQDRRQALMPLHARVLLIGGLVISALLIPTFFVGTMWIMAQNQGRFGLRPFEMEELSDCLGFSSIPVALLPGIVCWRYAHRLPRVILIPCRNCDCVHKCAIKEVNFIMPFTPEPEVTSDADICGEIAQDLPPLPVRTIVVEEGGYTARRLERIQKRRQKKAAADAGENEPNPDFDFNKPNDPPTT